jgi:hypothetical protein
MKILTTIAVFMLFTVFAQGQDLKGQWSGALSVQGSQLRIVFHVTKTDTAYKTTMDSPDQQAKDIPVSATSFKFPNVKFELAAIGGGFEGVMADDKTTITGKWSQSGMSLPLVLTKDKQP